MKKTNTSSTKKTIAVCAVSAVVIAAAVLIAVFFGGKNAEQRRQEELIDPIAEEIVFADKFPETVQEAYALVSQKVFLIGLEDRYQIDATCTAEAENSIRANGEEKVPSGVKRDVKNAIAALNEAAAVLHLDFGDETQNVLPDLSAVSSPDAFTADCTKSGVFRITLEYNGGDASLLLPEETAALEQTLKTHLGREDIRFNGTGAKVYAEIDGQHGILQVLEIRKTYHIGYADKEDVTFDFTCTNRYEVLRQGVYYTAGAVTMKQGQSVQLQTYTHLPQNVLPEDCTFTFRSSDETVLTVDGQGNVTALKPSEDSVIVTVMLMVKDDVHIYNDVCEITVTE